MDAQDTIIYDDVIRTQLIWYGHVEKMVAMRSLKIIIN
jgi:hypothetical protein